MRRNAGNKNVAFSRNDVLTEMTDAIGASFLGLTMGCARCHDHKFDDISQGDYYRLQAFLAATQEHDLVLADAKAQADWKARTDKINQQIKQLEKELMAKGAAGNKAIEHKLTDLRRSLPDPLPAIGTVHNVAGERTAIHILKRGDMDRPGPLVSPRPPRVLLAGDVPPLAADVKNPRTLLAQWLNEPGHPLTARVLVNRVWHYHFGRGIVATPNDFGVNGAPPSHPELLDYLANTFVAGGRRIKPLHRMILLSSTYRQAATPSDPSRGHRLDPDNRLLSRFPRRRLAAEEVRDALLAVAGQLNRKAGGPSVVVPVEADLVNLLYQPSQWTVTPNKEEHDRRSVYLLSKRNLPLPFAQVFDQPDAQTSCPRRESSTHALQALELLNGKLTNRLAEALAQRLVRECGTDKARQVERAFVLTAGRDADGEGKKACPGFPGEAAAERIRPGVIQPQCVSVRELVQRGSVVMNFWQRPRDRRSLLRDAFCGFGGLALASLLHEEALANPLAPKRPHRPEPRAKAVIFLLMAGGPSHLETFDPKPLLNKLHGQPRPAEFGEAKYQFIQKDARLLGTARKFTKHGRSGIPVSDLFPHTAGCIDDIAVVRSCHGDAVVHSAAQYELFTGRVLPGYPSMGSWVLFGLGTESQSLPGYVVLPDPHGALEAGQPMYANGFLPAVYQPTMFQGGSKPVRNLDLPPGVSLRQRRETIDLIRSLNQANPDPGDQELEARIDAFNLAFKMQTEAPEVFDLSRESTKTFELYGVGREPTHDFGRRCLLRADWSRRGCASSWSSREAARATCNGTPTMTSRRTTCAWRRRPIGPSPGCSKT